MDLFRKAQLQKTKWKINLDEENVSDDENNIFDTAESLQANWWYI